MSDKQQTKEQFIQQLTEENARKSFEEFPKVLYHPDGSTLTVQSRKEQDARGEEYFESPQEAIDEKEDRDQRASAKFVAAANAEAAAEQTAKDELFELVLADPTGAAAKAYPLIDVAGKSSSQILAELKEAIGATGKKPKK